jgi:phage tail tape-measure protein
MQLSVDDEAAALKALALCDRHGLSAAARALCGRLAARAAEAGLPGAALRWALRGGDGARGAALVAPVLAKLRARGAGGGWL